MDIKRQAFIKSMLINNISVEIRDELQENGEVVNYVILGVQDNGTYIEISKVIVHRDADIDLVIDEVGNKIDQYLELKYLMMSQKVLH